MAMLRVVGLQKAIVAEKLSVAGFSSVAVRQPAVRSTHANTCSGFSGFDLIGRV
jgi:hypothetical protein